MQGATYMLISCLQKNIGVVIRSEMHQMMHTNLSNIFIAISKVNTIIAGVAIIHMVCTDITSRIKPTSVLYIYYIYIV